MKRLLFILLACGTAVTSSARADDPTPVPAQRVDGTLPVTYVDTNKQDTSYNPDPGASERPVQAPFYAMPEGTPPDYGSEREPIIDQPHDPLIDVHAIHKVWQNRDYPEEQLPAGTQGVPDRWELAIPEWMRYNAPERESPYMSTDNAAPRLWDPYKQSMLKGDVPIIGQDIFLSLTANSFTSYEARDVPTPAGVSTNRSNESEFFGEGDQMEVDEFLALKIDLFKGETAFQPFTWDIHLMPVYNINYVQVKENGALSADPRGSQTQSDNNGVATNNSGNGTVSGGGNFTNPGGLTPGNPGGLLGPGNGFTYIGPQSQSSNQYTTRTKDFVSLQEAFLEFHLAKAR